MIEDGGTGIVCTRCGVRQAFVLPIVSRDFVRRVRAFNVLHENCPEPASDGTDPATGRGWFNRPKGPTHG